MLTDPAAQPFTNQWMVYDYWQRADNPAIRIDAKYDTSNVQIHDKLLKMQQLGYTVDGQNTGKHISMAGLQSRRLDIIHGTFRTTFKVEGANGGSCASFFWYRDDASELDIEAVTQGTSLVNNTINYTTQPSVFPDGSRIPNATRSVPMSDEFNTNIELFHEHRFDCDRAGGARFYLDGELMQVDAHNIPKFAGSLQLKLWADGNKWWSGLPSTTTVTMSVKNVIAYFNTSGTEDGTDEQWFKACSQAGGASDETICEAYAQAGKNDNIPLAASGVPPAQTSSTQDVITIAPGSTQRPMSDNNLGSDECYTTVRSGVLGVGPCKKSQAVRAQPLGLNSIHKFLTSCILKLRARFPPAPSVAEALLAGQSPINGADQCVIDPLGVICTHKSQAIRLQPFHLNAGHYSAKMLLARPLARLSAAWRDIRNFVGTAPVHGIGEEDSACESTAFPGCPSTADNAVERPVSGNSEGALFVPSVMIPPITPIFSDQAVRRAAFPGHPGIWFGASHRTSSQAIRNEPPMWSAVQKFFRDISHGLFPRDEPNYTMPFGSPMKSQAARARGPPWLNTLYASNSTPVTYKAMGREYSSQSNSTLASSHQQKQVEHADPLDKCKKEKFDRCSISEMKHIGQWWHCLNQRSDWCFFFGGSSFLLTNGLIQIVSVPVIFAWVFYLTET